ncbi:MULTISPECIES: AMP-binding protein [Rhodococcus]|uniref:AMP-binding protein n=1 Tax=Rhodococcus baikonurensis TaxID=172041 RepID=A0ABV5XED1_9NOCA|nr:MULTISPECIES: AMP-binding protein [Rhodococcus]KLN73064.1 propionyl-CoA synthetase [Rhodococcus erythropolis]KZF17852.1 propionyl-CoA synthetase [Rhodococcus sp. EPR-134]MDJ0441484.1 AMP-binding protein [Rhodococcus qingshengii]
MARYRDVYEASVADPERFWLDAAKALDWHTYPTVALDSDRAPLYRWFPDGKLNICHNALDRHVDAGHGDRTALIYDSPVSDTQRTYTYAELRTQVALFAGVLTDLGVRRGDRVVIYMPMVPEAAIAMLATARLGAVHSVVFGGFAPKELAARIDDAEPRVIVSASCGIEGDRIIAYKPLLDQAIEIAEHTPDHCVVLQRPQLRATMTDRDTDWDQAMSITFPAPCVTVKSIEPLYVLYTSGTTGKPKGVVRDGGYAVALAWTMSNVFDIGPGETMFTASDVGWVVGHSYMVYGPLLAGATTVIYEGKPVGTPDAAQFWRVVDNYQVKCLFTAPTALRAIRKQDQHGTRTVEYDLTSLRYLFLAGERLDSNTHRWASELLGIPVIDNWWQTETGWPIAANPAGIELLPIKPGSPTVPMPGWSVHVLDTAGRPEPPGAEGSIAIKLPLPPGSLPTLWQNDERFVESYLSTYDGYYLTGDGGHVDADGYVFITGRTDDVINVAGHRLSTAGMEEVISAHPDVAECAVIGIHDVLKGQIPRGLVVLKEGTARAEQDVEAELIQMVRNQIGAVAYLRDVAIVGALPKTRSGKILRKTMRGIADGTGDPIPPTIDDISVLEALIPVLRRQKGSKQ